MIWFVAFGPLVLLFIILTFWGRLGSHVQEAWGWLFATILPTLMLIVGVLVQQNADRHNEKVEANLFRLGRALSICYLALVYLVVMWSVFGAPSDMLSPLVTSNLFLGPIQGLAAAVIGFFFATSAPNEDDSDDAPLPDAAP